MNDIQMEERSSKKKLLVPLVVLMLCAVSVIGAGYAYTTTVTNQNNTMESDYYAIDLYSTVSGTPALVNAPFTIEHKVHFYTVKNISTGVDVKVAVPTGASNLCYVAVFDDDSSPSSTAAIDYTVAKTAGDGWTVEGKSLKNGTYGLTLSFNIGDADANGYHPVTFTLASDGTIHHATESSAQAAADAAATACNALRFSITFSSDKAA